MSVLIMILWALGLVFLGILWLGFIASLFEMGYGLVVRSPGPRPGRRSRARPATEPSVVASRP